MLCIRTHLNQQCYAAAENANAIVGCLRVQPRDNLQQW